jgi:hypothetical protein
MRQSAELVEYLHQPLPESILTAATLAPGWCAGSNPREDPAPGRACQPRSASGKLPTAPVRRHPGQKHIPGSMHNDEGKLNCAWVLDLRADSAAFLTQDDQTVHAAHVVACQVLATAPWFLLVPTSCAPAGLILLLQCA